MFVTAATQLAIFNAAAVSWDGWNSETKAYIDDKQEEVVAVLKECGSVFDNKAMA